MKRHLRVARKLATDPEIPRWLRWLLVFGLLPIPGPVDDLVVLFVAVVLVTCYRDRIRHQYAYEASMIEVVPMDTWGAWA
jgi:hypothetical protein